MDGFEYRFVEGLEDGGIAQAIRAAEGRLVAEVLEMEPTMGIVSVDIGSGIVADVYVEDEGVDYVEFSVNGCLVGELVQEGF